MSFHSKKLTPEQKCLKFKKEVYALLMRPDRIQPPKNIMVSREEMAHARLNHIFDSAYAKTRKQYKEQFKEAKITKRRFFKQTGWKIDELIELGKSALSDIEKERILDSQSKRTAHIASHDVPNVLKVTEEEFLALPEFNCKKIVEYIDMTPEGVIEKYPDLFDPKKRKKRKKRKVSNRNRFIGVMMRKGNSMKEASDQWKELSVEEKAKYSEPKALKN